MISHTWIVLSTYCILVDKFVYKYISENAVIHDRLSLAKKRTKCRLDINIFHSLFFICSVLSNKPST